MFPFGLEGEIASINHYFKPSNPPAECPPTKLLLAITREPSVKALAFSKDVKPNCCLMVSIADWSLSSFSIFSTFLVVS